MKAIDRLRCAQELLGCLIGRLLLPAASLEARAAWEVMDELEELERDLEADALAG